MRRGLRASSVAAACLGALATGAFAMGVLAGACTTFNGVTVPPEQSPPVDASMDVVVPDVASEPRVEAAVEASAPRSLLSLQDAARACALAARCPYLAPSIQGSIAVPADPSNFSLCMHWLAGPFPPDRLGYNQQQQVLACVAKATTCQAGGSCVSYETLNTGDPRCADAGADSGPRCVDNGATVLSCAGLWATHCDSANFASGSVCTQGLGDLGCALGKNCTVVPSCIGSSVFDECGVSDGLHYRFNCDYAGYDCSETADASLVGCLTGSQSEPCNTIETSCSADGKSVQVCDGYDYSLFDCAALSGSCSSTGGVSFCATKADTCTPFDPSVNTCSGTSLSLCIGGKPQTFDCSTIGLTCKGAAGSGQCG